MLHLIQIPVWRDNYAYLLVRGQDALVIDAPEADPIQQRLARDGLRLKAILNTHHHPDHVGANLDLQAATGCSIYGPAHDAERIPGLTHGVDIGARMTLLGVHFDVLDVAAHTRGHICFRLNSPLTEVWRHGHDGEAARVPRLENRGALFCGDSLFIGGCGRLFEGDAAMLERSLRVYAEADPDLLVVCAHEYTESNLRFAAHILPGDEAIATRARALDAERQSTRSSVPDVLAREHRCNPFLRAFAPQVQAELAERLGCSNDTAAVLYAMRKAKDSF